MREEILKVVREKGLLLERELFDVLDRFENAEQAKNFLDNLEKALGNKIITVSSLSKNFEYVREIVNELPGETKAGVERIFVKLGLSLEIKREYERVAGELAERSQGKKQTLRYQVLNADDNIAKKIEVKDFVGHFRARYQELQKILMGRPDVQGNLISINKLGTSRQSLSIIGIVTEKRITKNKNIILRMEDLTGEISAMVKYDGECFKKARELQLDDVVAIKGTGNKEIVFIYDIFWPDSFLLNKTRFEEDTCIAFVSDVHAGSDKHLGEEFQRFIDWLNSGDETAARIKYIFFVGDNIDGVGVFPGQERVLKFKSVREQYSLLAGYLKQVPKEITMFMCPGQHDAVRVAEPQPPIGKEQAAKLHEINNLIFVSNPSMIKLFEGEKEFKVLMYHGASIHVFINEIEELRMMKAHRCPSKAVKHMLKRRHLAPMHGVAHSIVYTPNGEYDPMVIKEVPDVLCTGEVHRVDIDTYNGTKIITGSCWQSQTEYEEKLGNLPDPCKVPVLNLKTGELKILDFTEKDEI